MQMLSSNLLCHQNILFFEFNRIISTSVLVSVNKCKLNFDCSSMIRLINLGQFKLDSFFRIDYPSNLIVPRIDILTRKGYDEGFIQIARGNLAGLA